MQLLDDENTCPTVHNDTSKDDYRTTVICWSHPKSSSWSLCQLHVTSSRWWVHGFGISQWSHGESSHCRLIGQLDVNNHPPSCKLGIVRMVSTGRKLFHGMHCRWVHFLHFALWMDGW
jgi:hypothetical protein